MYTTRPSALGGTPRVFGGRGARPARVVNVGAPRPSLRSGRATRTRRLPRGGFRPAHAHGRAVGELRLPGGDDLRLCGKLAGHCDPARPFEPGLDLDGAGLVAL